MKGAASYVPKTAIQVSQSLCALTLPELEQSKAAVPNTLASAHSRRSYEYAIARFIAWYCDEPQLAFNRSLVVRYRSFLESLSLSGATINLHLSAIRRLADESAESGWRSPELVTGIRRVRGVKQLGRKIGNWLTGNHAQELLNSVSHNTRGRRDGAMLGLLFGCGLRRSEVVGLRLDQMQLRESHWGIVDLLSDWPGLVQAATEILFYGHDQAGPIPDRHSQNRTHDSFLDNNCLDLHWSVR